VLAWEIQELPGAQTMFTTQWDCFVPYTIEDVRTFTASGTDAAVVQRVRLERDRQALYTADLFLYHRQLKRRMVWQFIAVNVRDGNLRLDFPTPFQFVDKEWQQLVTRAFISALQAVQANPDTANGLILNADFPVPDEVPPLSGSGENRVAPGFAWNELYVHSVKRYLFASERVQGWHVLDLGCGVGYGAKILARSAAQVVAADVDEHPLRYGEETYPDAKIQRVHIAPVTEAQGLPFADGSFDAVVSFEVIEHVPVEQMQAFFAEMARVLKPSGAVILSTPNKNVYIHYPDPYHVSLMTLEEFSRLLNSQFEDVQVYGQLRSKGLPHTTMEFDIVDEARDDQEIFVAVCRGYRGRQATISLPEPTVWEQPREQGTAPGQRLPVSVIVHTRNEEHNIEQCLECLKDWAGEIIVMDMESTDRTVEIARRYTDKIYTHPLIRDFDAARNVSAKHARYDWIFYVDADERVPPALVEALRQMLPALDNEVAAVKLTYKNYFLGKWIRYAGQWYPGYKAPMLLRRGRFEWLSGAHEGVKVFGRIVLFPPDNPECAIEHHTTPTLERYMHKLSHYSQSAAKQMLEKHAPCSWQTLAAAMGYAFRFYYDETRGYQDGAHGFLLSACAAMSALADQIRYAELLLNEGWEGSDLLPASAEEFFRFAADVAAGRVHVVQKNLSHILALSSDEQKPDSLPSWWQRLWLRLQRASGGRVVAAGSVRPVLSAPEWQMITDDEQADALIAFGEGWSGAVARLREGGSFFIATPHFPADPEAWRAELEQAFQATVHLLDPEATCSWLFAFGWKGQRVEPARRRVLMLTHQNALHMLGGGETQLFETLLALREQKVAADVSLSLRLPEQVYDLIHVFSLYHADKVECLTCTEKPVVVSTIFRDNAALYPVTVGAAVFQQEDALQVERALRAWKEGNLRVQGLDGQSLDEPEEVRRVKQLVVERAQLLLPNCRWELSALRRYFGPGDKPAYVVPNAVRPERFLEATPDAFVQRFGLRDFVLCAARIEPFKNQLMLIWALRDNNIPLVLAGKVSDSEYGALCERWSGKNVHFVGELAPDLLASAYAAARVHAMPSWAETPSLTSMEAALAGCAIVVGNQGAEREYFGEFAYYCNPADIDSVREAVLAAWEDRDVARRKAFREYILKRYTWSETARVTAEAYEQVLRFRQSLLAMPDWNEPQTWQPVVERYLREHQPGDGSLLQLYAGAYNSFHAEVAYRLLEQFIVSIGFDPEHCADIEVIDELPENLLGQIWWTGSRYDSILRTRYQGRTAA
jgi:2-polyprenyl-3-methyl-5-hydroxy-6-metoxy-1,4-benzoquinol methylase/glycosyltransferase involved in cell wall biosynthesis